MTDFAVLEWSASKHKEKSTKYWEGEPIEESRQYYANVRIAEWQNFRNQMPMPFTFEELIFTFRFYGEEYDRGARLMRDKPRSRGYAASQQQEPRTRIQPITGVASQ